MAELSNKSMALLVLAALVVVIIATSLQLNKLDELGVAGLATVERTGQVNLTIGTALNIEVDSTNNGINFGTCTPNASRGEYVVNSNDSTGDIDCTGDTATNQNIQVNNIGNVDAAVEVWAACDGTTFIPTSGAGNGDFNYTTWGTGCAGTTATNVAMGTDLGGGTGTNACTNLTTAGAGANSFNMSAIVTIPTTATGNGGCTQNTITFGAETA